ncbi:MAG: FAD-binding oxidoreductase, partial [Humibacter sp.]
MPQIATLAPPDPRLISALDEACGRVAARASDRLAGAHDASHYQLTPLAVVTASDASEVAGVLAAARTQGVPVTFRSGGTSLSGQASTDGLLLDTRHHFRGV